MFHILVVDDDKNTRMYFEAVLKSNNYTVTVAKNGEEALEVMDKEHIDLVVLDIMMPKMDGYEFTKTLRECDNNLPILMVSAKQLPVDKNKGFAVGTDDYMTKPVNQDEFLYRIKALLRRAKIANERKIVLGNVVLDYDSLTVTKDDEGRFTPRVSGKRISKNVYAKTREECEEKLAVLIKTMKAEIAEMKKQAKNA